MKRALMLGVALALVVGIAPGASAADSAGAAAEVSVSGVVTDAATGKPVADVCVAVRPDDQNWWDEKVCTGADGSYQFAVAPARYEVQFDPRSDDYGTQWWAHATTPSNAERLVLHRGAPATGIDAALAPGATMTGRAIDGATGKPLADACVEISAADVEDDIAFLQNPPDNWEIKGLPAGPLTVRVAKCSLIWARFTWAYDALTIEDATAFNLTPGATTDIGALALIAGATIKGRVTARKTGEPLPVSVDLDYFPGRSGEPAPFHASVRQNGRYVIRDVQPGPHTPVAYDGRPEHTYGPQWAGGATSFGSGDRIDFAPNKTEHVNFKLDLAATISGTFVGDDEGLFVDAYSRDFGDVGNQSIVGFPTYIHPDGTFTITGLPAADTYVCFSACFLPEYGGFWYDGAYDIADATLVHLKVGKTTHITAHRPPAGG